MKLGSQISSCLGIFNEYWQAVLPSSSRAEKFKPSDRSPESVCYPSPDGIVEIGQAEVNQLWGNYAIEDLIGAERASNYPKWKQEQLRFVFVAVRKMLATVPALLDNRNCATPIAKHRSKHAAQPGRSSSQPQPDPPARHFKYPSGASDHIPRSYAANNDHCSPTNGLSVGELKTALDAHGVDYSGKQQPQQQSAE
jgi:hypothetical protein